MTPFPGRWKCGPALKVTVVTVRLRGLGPVVLRPPAQRGSTATEPR
jgi:hypothetical protein